MDKEYLMNCSYNDLKKIAVDHDILKSIKSKKKDVLLEKLVDYFSESKGAMVEVSAKNDVDTIKEVSCSPKKSSKSRKGKKTQSKDIQIRSSEDEISEEKQDLQEIASKTGNFVIPKKGTSSDEEISELPKKGGRKGKRTRSKDVLISEDEISDETVKADQDLKEIASRRGTFVIQNKGIISDEEISELPKTSCKRKRARSKDVQINEAEISKETIEANQDLQEIASRRGTFVIPKKGAISDKEISELPKKRGRKGKRTSSKDVLISEDETVEVNQDLQETANRRGTFVVSKIKDTDIVEEFSELPKKSNKSRKGKKTKSKDIQIRNSEDDIADEKNAKTNLDLLDDINKRGTSEVSKMSKNTAEEKSQSPKESIKSGKGKRTRSKDVQTNISEDYITEETSVEENPNLTEIASRRGTFVIPKKGQISDEEISELPKKRGRKGKGTRSKDVLISEDEISDETVKANQDLQEIASRRGTFVIPKKGAISDEEIPELPKKRGRKGKATRSKDVLISEDEISDETVKADQDLQDRKENLAVSTHENTDTVEETSEPSNKSNKGRKGKKTNSKNKKIRSSEDESSELTFEVKPGLPEGPVPITSRRGTFTITNSKSPDNVTNEVELDGSILRSQENRRKQFDTGESFLKENGDGKSTSANESSPKETKKVGIVAPVTSHLINKTVNFITPGNSRKRTPKNNVTLTPHPTKKSLTTPLSKRSISSPLSVKKTPGQFSAKKMPNFAKIHQKNFEKMESLVAYSERKNVQRKLISPLNKTFTGLSVKENVVKKLRNSTGRQPVKSLIPVRSTIIRLEDKEKIKAFAKKTHVTNIEAMREKERGIIKGVRANKRFMLQMKMRKIDL